jgi:hypothetical protein
MTIAFWTCSGCGSDNDHDAQWYCSCCHKIFEDGVDEVTSTEEIEQLETDAGLIPGRYGRIG